jgi:hypothetical protein
MGRMLKSRFRFTTLEWITLLLLAMFCAVALIPEVREWVLDYVHQITAAIVNGNIG